MTTKQLRDAVGDLADRFEKMEPTEKAAVLRFLASESTDAGKRKELIIHALRWDAIALARRK